jgi:hypothetical protein
MKGINMAVRGDAKSITEKWKTRTSGATQEVIAGVARVTTAPGVQAAKQKQAYINNTVAKVDKWERNVAAVSLQSWQASTTAGAQRIAAGVQAKAGKMESFLVDFLPHVERVQQRVQSMPRGDINQNIARMIENAKGMAEFKRSGNR